MRLGALAASTGTALPPHGKRWLVQLKALGVRHASSHRNVIVDRSSKSALTSNDAQSAFEELSLDLVATMVGTWNIVNKNIENEHAATGQVRINADGTFTLLAGSFAVSGLGWVRPACTAARLDSHARADA
jgi:hypothetical protein